MQGDAKSRRFEPSRPLSRIRGAGGGRRVSGLSPRAWGPQEGREERRKKKVAKLSQKKKKAEKRRLYKERKQGEIVYRMTFRRTRGLSESEQRCAASKRY